MNNFFEIIKIIKPDLWWPSGHGKQCLYNFKIKIHSIDFAASSLAGIGKLTSLGLVLVSVIANVLIPK